MGKSVYDESLESANRRIIRQDPKIGIDEPWQVTRLVIEDAMRMFHRLTGRPPKKLYLPVVVEIALQVDMGRSGDGHGKIRDLRKKVLGCDVQWDAEEFKVE